ncbi:MAG: ferredoxin--nitrite reductase [Dehalococcoidia bacterium]
MNKIERIKAERGGLEVGRYLEQFARDGWEAIPEDDRNTRLKWWGVFFRKQTPGYFMMRIRIPNGIATADQVREIGAIARELGRDTIDITTRQQLQLRWIRIEDVPGIIDRLRSAGLVTLQTGMDNLRNVVGCPVAGLTSSELFDASPVACEFSDLIVGNPAFTNLPRKLNVTITGCLENCAHAETQDIALVPARGAADVDVEGFNVLVGGKMGSGGYRVASPLDVFVTPSDASKVVAEIALIFRDHGSREARNHARLAFLIEDWGLERVRAVLEERIGHPLARAGIDARSHDHTDHIGVSQQRQPEMNYVGLLVPVGRGSGTQLEELARLAATYGDGQVRFTVGQNAIVSGVHDDQVPALLNEPLLEDWRVEPSEVARGTVTCTGKDFCALALIETKGYAQELVATLEARLPGHRRPISIAWSGCPSGCGNHQTADIGLVGRRTKVDGDVIDAVDIYIGGSSGPAAVPGIKLMENVPSDELPRLAEFLVRYGDLQLLRQQLRATTSTQVEENALVAMGGNE